MATRKFVANINLNQNEIQNPVAQNLAAAPSSPKAGQFWFDTADDTLKVKTASRGIMNALSQGDYTFQNGVELVSGTRNVQLKLGTSSNATVTADSSGLAVSVADASTSAKGVIEIATDAEASTGTAETLAVNPKQLATKVTANNAITGATKCKITYDAKGLVTAGADLSASDIPDISATYVLQTAVGAASGVASLDSNGKVPTAQLPSFVDDVIDAYIVSGATEFSSGWLSKTNGGSALTPETDKIYVIVESGSAYENKTYRWSGSTYVEISASPAQATESTAGIAAIATQAEVTTGTNDTKFVTPLKLATYTSGMVKKTTATNPALTASGGVCTWTISSTPSNPIVSIRETSSGEEVYTEVVYGSSSITIKINSASNISAGTYTAVVVG